MTFANRIFLAGICGVFLFATAFAGGKKGEKPGWIEGNIPEKWNRTQYLVGVGSGKSLEEASASARKAIAEVLHSKVQSHFSKESNSALNESTSGQTQGSDSSAIKSNLEIKVNTDLHGVEIVESYTDPEDKTVYALAAVNKLRVRNLYSQESMKLKTRITAKYEQFKTESRPADGQEVLDLMEKFEQMLAEYAVYSDGGTLPSPLQANQVEEVRKKLGELNANRSISLEMSGEQPPFRDLIEACLTQKKIRVVPGSESSAVKYLVKGTVLITDQPINVEGWLKNEISVHMTVSGISSGIGSIVATRTSTCRGKQACFDKVKDELANEACENILKLINNK